MAVIEGRELPRVEVDPEFGQVYVCLRPNDGDEHLPVWSTVLCEDPLTVLDRCKCHDEVYGVEIVG